MSFNKMAAITSSLRNGVLTEYDQATLKSSFNANVLPEYVAGFGKYMDSVSSGSKLYSTLYESGKRGNKAYRLFGATFNSGHVMFYMKESRVASKKTPFQSALGVTKSVWKSRAMATERGDFITAVSKSAKRPMVVGSPWKNTYVKVSFTAGTRNGEASQRKGLYSRSIRAYTQTFGRAVIRKQMMAHNKLRLKNIKYIMESAGRVRRA